MAINKQFFDIFKKGSKTYFYSSLLFPAETREDIFILYSFVRTADNYVDTIPQQKKQFILFVDQYLDALKKGSSKNIVIDQFVKLMIRKNIDKKLVSAFLTAMHQDLSKKKYKTILETEEYIYGSAEVIGIIMSKILDIPPSAYPYAKSLGKAIQYINFIRDIAEDNLLNRTYLPEDQLKKYHLPDLSYKTAIENEDNFTEFIRAEIHRYYKWQQKAEQGFKFIPKKHLLAIKTASDLYKWTAHKIYHDPFIVYNKKVKPPMSTIITQAGSNLLWNKQ